jgi:hypothetical protein
MGMSACKSVVINLEIVQVQVRFKDWWSGPSGVPLRRTFRSPGCFARRPNAERLDRLLPVIIYCKAGLGDKENERQSISQNIAPMIRSVLLGPIRYRSNSIMSGS